MQAAKPVNEVPAAQPAAILNVIIIFLIPYELLLQITIFSCEHHIATKAPIITVTSPTQKPEVKKEHSSFVFSFGSPSLLFLLFLHSFITFI